MERTILIMAGGQGERFWPYSRRKYPKQFLRLTDEKKTMIQLTMERACRFTDIQHIFVATNRNYYSIVREQIPDLPEENMICEPVGKNTAPCVALGAAHIARRYGDALMTVLPSDHLVKIPPLFIDTLREACDFAEQGPRLVTIGITPSGPETGYGYIRFLSERVQGGVYRVNGFVEKPSLDKAKEYAASGEYLWNSGMFIWKASTILESLNRYMPEVSAGLQKIRQSIGTPDYDQVLEEVFAAFPSVSIDYGILEKADNLYTIAGNFGWDDVGSWLAVSRIHLKDDHKNSIQGNVIAIDSEDVTILGGSKLITAVGLHDLIVVDTEDAILICDKGRTGDIRTVLRVLKEKGLEQFL